MPAATPRSGNLPTRRDRRPAISIDRRREALATLSLFYRTPNLTVEQREQLLVASRSLATLNVDLLRPRLVGRTATPFWANETLMDIAQNYDVPWQLLANITGVSDRSSVLPVDGFEKSFAVRFRAGDVDLVEQRVDVFLGDFVTQADSPSA